MDDKVVVEVCQRLERFGLAIARKVLRKLNLEFDSHQMEDIGQSLLLQGYKVWRDTGGDVELAKNRMRTRASNELQKLVRESKQPRPTSSIDLPKPRSAREGTDDTEQYHAEEVLPYRRFRAGPVARASPLEDMKVQEYLDGLPDRSAWIVRCLTALMTLPEIAAELGVSISTVEREIRGIRKERKDGNAG